MRIPYTDWNRLELLAAISDHYRGDGLAIYEDRPLTVRSNSFKLPALRSDDVLFAGQMLASPFRSVAAVGFGSRKNARKCIKSKRRWLQAVGLWVASFALCPSSLQRSISRRPALSSGFTHFASKFSRQANEYLWSQRWSFEFIFMLYINGDWLACNEP